MAGLLGSWRSQCGFRLAFSNPLVSSSFSFSNHNQQELTRVNFHASCVNLTPSRAPAPAKLAQFQPFSALASAMLNLN
jgi:hypothetical protein